MNIILEIDYRERSIIKDINGLEQIKISEEIYNCKELDFKISNLLIGDFIIKNKDTDELFYIIERKTIDDLCSSITDNRWREQKERLLLSTNDPSKIIYIIEGSKNNISNFSKINKKTINSAIQNVILKHNYKVIFSDSISDTTEQLTLLYKKIKTGDLFNNPTKHEFKKKSDKLNSNIFINQLTVIPGVSINTAEKIINKYPSLLILIKAFENNELLLTDIQITDKRKLGKMLSKKVYSAFFD